MAENFVDWCQVCNSLYWHSISSNGYKSVDCRLSQQEVVVVISLDPDFFCCFTHGSSSNRTGARSTDFNIITEEKTLLVGEIWTQVYTVTTLESKPLHHLKTWSSIFREDKVLLNNPQIRFNTHYVYQYWDGCLDHEMRWIVAMAPEKRI